MTHIGLLFLFASAFCTALYSLLFKKAVLSVGQLTLSLQYLVKIALHPLFILALVFYGFSVLTWIRVNATEPLSVSYPLMLGSCLILASFGSYLFLDEAISVQKSIGLGIIVIGIMVLAGRPS